MAVREELKSLDLKNLIKNMKAQTQTIKSDPNSPKSRFFVLEKFGTLKSIENRGGGSYIQMYPIDKHSVITISEKELEQNDYKDALNSGKLIKIDNVKVKSLIDVGAGCPKSNMWGDNLQYKPCKFVELKKGQEVSGWIHPISGVFNPLDRDISTLKKGQYEIISNENKTKNNLVNGLFVVVGLFIAYKVLKTAKIL